jgi:hypothetical protein
LDYKGLATLSILVVSKTASLLSNMLRSIPTGLGSYGDDVEVLCSWNGTNDEEQTVEVPPGIELYFAQRIPYHFSSNVNRLAERACGELLLLANDDLIFGPGSIEHSTRALKEHSNTGIVGAKLINTNGKVDHSGILFDHSHKPFHRYRGAATNHPFVERTELVPATTGAFMLTRAADFSRCPMNENYANNGEDIEICLSYKSRLGLNTLYCHEACCIHPERTTRGHEVIDRGFGNDNSEDLSRLRKARLDHLLGLNSDETRWELSLASREASYWHAIAEDNIAPTSELAISRKATQELRLQARAQAVECERLMGELDIANLAANSLKAELQAMQWRSEQRTGNR